MTESKQVVCTTYPATRDGLLLLEAQANDMEPEYELMTVVKLDKKIAAVYRRTVRDKQEYGSFDPDDVVDK